MKLKQICGIPLLLVCLLSCTSDQPDPLGASEDEIPESLPFSIDPLSDFSIFNEQPDNWVIAGEVFVDRSVEMKLEEGPGTGILVNTAPAPEGSNLFTAFEHGDLELELDVMVPKGSNSGIYFQGRYEVQVFDSWGVENPQHLDMGGIYQRWDPTKPEGQQGYEGHAPAINAARSPGLWQHYRIIFQAPRFDAAGNKIQNAVFKEIWLNGIQLHENVRLNGPTRAAAFDNEVAMAPLMLQGDHGPVAYRNIRYKKYDGTRVQLQNMKVAEYDYEIDRIPNLDTLEAKSARTVDSISYRVGSRPARFLLAYEGQLNIPKSGDYLFHLRTATAGAVLIIDGDTLLEVGGRTGFEEVFRSRVTLKQGAVPFQLIYNKHCCGRRKGLSIEVEGPGVQRHALTAPGSASVGSSPYPIVIELEEVPVLQRGFLMHDGAKLTHAISVGTPEGLHYSYDLAMGALLQVWSGDFLDVTDMWHSRGQRQLSKPRGLVLDFHGAPNVFQLPNASADWPDSLQASQGFKPVGYELDKEGYPIFIYETNGVEVRNELLPSNSERRVTRKISLSNGADLWLKIDGGSSIKLLADGSYAVNDHEYFVELADELQSKASVRSIDGQQELLIQLQSGAQTVQYAIIW